MFDFKNIYEKYGLIMDRDDYPSETGDKLYYDTMVAYATEHRLSKYVFKSEFFFSDSENNVYNYILQNYSKNNNENFKLGEVVENTSIIKPLPTIAEILKEKNMNAADFSKLFSIPYNTVKDWRNGQRKPTTHLIALLVWSLDKFSLEEISEKMSSSVELPTIKDILTQNKLTLAEFSKLYEVPSRTTQDWSRGKSKPPVYFVKLLLWAIENNYSIEVIKNEYYY